MVFYVKLVLLRFFFVKLRCFYRVYKPEILVFSYALLALKTISSTRPTVGARMFPPKLYLVDFLSSEPGELDKDNLFGLQRTFSLASRKLVVLYHMFIPHGGIVINVLA